MKGKALFVKELSWKSIKELVEMRKKLKKELFELKSKNAIRGLKETHKIADTKIKIARINTFLALKIKEKDGNNMK